MNEDISRSGPSPTTMGVKTERLAEQTDLPSNKDIYEIRNRVRLCERDLINSEQKGVISDDFPQQCV